MSREFARHLRVRAELQRILNDLLQGEVKDPRLSDVRISDVDLSADLGVARVFYAPLIPDSDLGPVEAAFEKAAPFIRGRVGRELKLRRVPELRFEADRSVAHGMEIGALIDSTRPHPHDDDAGNE